MRATNKREKSKTRKRRVPKTSIRILFGLHTCFDFGRFADVERFALVVLGEFWGDWGGSEKE